MDSRQSPGAARVVGLEAASRNLREVLGIVLLLEKKDQDEVAGAMQGLVQQLLLAARLNALPSGVLATIIRKVGRPVRRATYLLKHTYGPLDCGLRLHNIDAMHDFSALLDADPTRFHMITTLDLSNVTVPATFMNAFLDSVPGALPHLASISFEKYQRVAFGLASLLPLAPCLTSLKDPFVVGNLATTLLPLTALRSLAFESAFDTAADVTALQGLSTLRQLQHLEVSTVATLASQAVPAAVWLSSLSSLSGLTSLAACLVMREFDAAALSMLRTALPKLCALTFLTDFTTVDNGPVVLASSVEVPAALAQRTALTALHLDDYSNTEEHMDLRCLSSLQLFKLWMRHAPDQFLVAGLLEALSVQSQLTSLHLEGEPYDGTLDFTGTAAGSLLLAGRLRQLGLHAVDQAHVGGFAEGLSLLTELTLAAISTDTGYFKMSWLAGLTSLEVLDFGAQCSDSFCKAVLNEVSSLTCLRKLSLDFDPDTYFVEDDPEKMEEELVRDADLWKLFPLRHTLTGLTLGRSQWAIDHPGAGSEDAKARGVEGPGLGVVGKLTGLKELALVRLAVLGSPLLPEYLLPLPPGLTRLEVEWLRAWGPSLGVIPRLQDAAALQDCAFLLEVV